MGNRVKGITVQLGGDTTGLDKALSGVNKNIRNTQRELKDVNKLLKMDPKNVELQAQKQHLLTEEIGKTKEKLTTLKTAEKQAQEQFKQGKISREQYDALQREIIETEHELSNLEASARESNSAIAKVGEVSDKVAAGAQKVADGAQNLADKTKAVSAAAAGALVAAGTASIKFGDGFAKLSTVLDDSKTDYDQYRDDVLEGAKEMGIAPGMFVDSVYSAISASVDQADAIGFTTDAAKLAKGGFTDLTKSVDVLTTAINGYGLSADQAGNISDILITTQNLGKTTVDELASSMGAVIPIASAANFSIDELAAGYALMTKNGIATSETGTYMKSMLSELTKAGSSTDLALRELTGKGFADLKKEGMSTSQVLGMLTDYASDNEITLKDMFGSVEAGSAALMLAKGNGDEFNAMLDAMQDSAGATDKAFEKVNNTTGAKFRKSLNDIAIAGIKLGDAMAPVIEKIADILTKVTEYLSGLDDEQLQTIATVLMVIAAVSPLLSIISKVSLGVKGIAHLISFLIANPIAAIIAAVVALVALIAIKGDEIQAALQKLDDWLQGIFAKDWTEVFGPYLGGVLNNFFGQVKGFWDSIKQVFDGIIDFIRGIFTGDWERVWNGVVEIFSGIWQGIVAAAKAPLNGLIGMVNGVISAINWMIDGINKIPNVNLGHIGTVPLLAKGGVVHSGSAIVGEAGPELLTVGPGGTQVTPLTNNSNYSTNYGGVSMTVVAAPGQSVQEVADAVMSRLNNDVLMREAAF